MVIRVDNKTVYTAIDHSVQIPWQSEIYDLITQVSQQEADIRLAIREVLENLSPHFRDTELGLGLCIEENDVLEPIWVNDVVTNDSFYDEEGDLWHIANEAFKNAKDCIEFELDEETRIYYIPYDESPCGVFIMRGGDKVLSALLKPLAIQLSLMISRFKESETFLLHPRSANKPADKVKKFNSTQDLENILDSTDQAIRELFSIEAAYVLLCSNDENKISLKIPLGEAIPYIRFFNEPVTHGIVAHSIMDSIPMIVNDVETHPYYSPEVDGLNGCTEYSLLSVPLQIDGRSIGAIVLINNQSGPFTRQDAERLSLFSHQVSSALQYCANCYQFGYMRNNFYFGEEWFEDDQSALLSVFSNIEDEVFIIDDSYSILAINRARADRIKKEPRKLMRKHCYEVFENRDSICDDCFVRETFGSGVKTNWIKCSKGLNQLSDRWEVYTYPIKSRDGRIRKTIVHLRNITEQRRLEASLLHAGRLATIGQLVAEVAHELNNPLTAVIANSQWLQRQIESQSKYHEKLKLIEMAGFTAHAIIRDLLEFAREGHSEFELVDVNHSIEQTISLIAIQWKNSNVTLISDLSTELPRIWGNSNYLQSVWLNLLVNAKEAIDKNNGEVRIQSFARDDKVVVQVKDNGVGIQPTVIERIFDPFFTTKVEGHGTGLGLAMVSRVVQEHQGGIRVESFPGEGTQVEVTFPFASLLQKPSPASD
jgi:two-component system NtrC family sensor kinase